MPNPATGRWRHLLRRPAPPVRGRRRRAPAAGRQLPICPRLPGGGPRGVRALRPQPPGQPSFETNRGLDGGQRLIKRVTSDAAADAGGTCCGEFAWSSARRRWPQRPTCPALPRRPGLRASLWLPPPRDGRSDARPRYDVGTSPRAHDHASHDLDALHPDLPPSATLPTGTPVRTGPQVYIRMPAARPRRRRQVTRGLALLPKRRRGAAAGPTGAQRLLDISFPGGATRSSTLRQSVDEVNTTGWTSGAVSLVTPGRSPAWPRPKFGTVPRHGRRTGEGRPTGYYAITGTFKPGCVLSAAGSCSGRQHRGRQVRHRSNGTRADRSSSSQTTTANVPSVPDLDALGRSDRRSLYFGTRRSATSRSTASWSRGGSPALRRPATPTPVLAAAASSRPRPLRSPRRSTAPPRCP